MYQLKQALVEEYAMAVKNIRMEQQQQLHLPAPVERPHSSAQHSSSQLPGAEAWHAAGPEQQRPHTQLRSSMPQPSVGAWHSAEPEGKVSQDADVFGISPCMGDKHEGETCSNARACEQAACSNCYLLMDPFCCALQENNEGTAPSPAAPSPAWSDMGSSAKLRGGNPQRGLLARLGSQRFVLQARNTPDSKVEAPMPGGQRVKFPGLRMQRYDRFGASSDSINY
jgi:hypothetical protein